MVYDYLITLKKPDYKLADQVSQLMYIFALLAFGFFYYSYRQNGVIYLIIGAGILLGWAYALSKKRKNGVAYFRLGLLIAAAGWFFEPGRNIWMAILYLASGIFEKQVKFSSEIGFSTDEISFNTFPRKVMNWNELNNVVIKDGLITIDKKNNKLYQKEIEGYVTAEIEQEFNRFCSQQISQANA